MRLLSCGSRNTVRALVIHTSHTCVFQISSVLNRTFNAAAVWKLQMIFQVGFESTLLLRSARSEMNMSTMRYYQRVNTCCFKSFDWSQRQKGQVLLLRPNQHSALSIVVVASEQPRCDLHACSHLFVTCHTEGGGGGYVVVQARPL